MTRHRFPTLFGVLQRLATSRHFRLGLAFFVILFVLTNSVLFFVYKDRTYPNTTVAGHHFGSVSDDQLATRLKQSVSLPMEITFKQDALTTKVKTTDVGVSVNYQGLRTSIRQERSWLPIANLVQRHTIALDLKQDPATIQSVVGSGLQMFERTPTNAQIIWENTAFIIKPEASGQEVDKVNTKKVLIETLGKGQATVQVAVKPVKAAITGTSLKAELQKLNKQAQTSVTLQYNGQSKKLTANEIASLYGETAAGLTISDAAIITLINNTGATWGIVIDNQTASASAIRSALENQKDVLITLIAAPKVAKTIRFCTSVRGVSESLIAELDAKLKSTFADSRGWGLNGLVRFQKVDSDCELRVWLSSAEQMPSFGAICDSMWSCAVSPNVVINYDRWTQTSPAWQASGGSLEDYRSMVINHETGHWFGFYHSFCGGPGQQAPVMQQQSIDLQGCTFNPWPTVNEQARLKQQFGL